jgi:3-oxoacyl-[acyl-carrier-protein] synthase II
MSLLRSGQLDVALAGGVDAALTRLSIIGFNNLLAMSEKNDRPERASRPFDRERDGFVLSEGGAMLVLETERRARRRGAPIAARLLGSAATSEAYHLVQPSVDGKGMATCMLRALADAGISPDSVQHVNAHGTSTRINDQYETLALKHVFHDHAYRLLINAPKSMIGHSIGGAGAIEAAITALSLRESVIPPTVNYEYPDPDCDLFYTPSVAHEAPNLRRAISNSFAFGGHNCTLVFERME